MHRRIVTSVNYHFLRTARGERRPSTIDAVRRARAGSDQNRLSFHGNGSGRKKNSGIGVVPYARAGMTNTGDMIRRLTLQREGMERDELDYGVK